MFPGPRDLEGSALELTADRAFARRVARMALISVVALGTLWALSRKVEQAHPAFSDLLAGGWLLMPVVMLASLRRPRLRFALVVPATLVSIALMAITVTAASQGGAAAAGWILVTSGVLMGSTLGLWFWFRLFRVPNALNDPFSRWRWALVGLHVALVILGVLLVTLR